MMVESTNSAVDEPDNELVIEYLRAGINRLTESFEMHTDHDPREQ